MHQITELCVTSGGWGWGREGLSGGDAAAGGGGGLIRSHVVAKHKTC